MNGWRSGTVDRERIGRVARRLAPARAIDRLPDLSLDDLQAAGKRLILLDVDHTLVAWKEEAFLPDVEAWVSRAKAMGFDLCILSNTRRPERLARIAERLGIAFVRDKFKPSPAMFRLALIKFSRTAEEAVMIGDQLFTDVLGANRSGIDAVWVRKHDGPEFAGTRYVSRNLERLVRGAIWKALVLPEDERRDAPATTTLQQLVRFAVVGGSSFLIDYSIRMTLLFATPFGPAVGAWVRANAPWIAADAKSVPLAALPVAGAIAWAVATLNSFVWNRVWTFEAKGHDARRRQMVRFFLIAAVGGLINVTLSTLLVHLVPFAEKPAARIATVLGTGVAAVWNFVGQKLFAFRRRPA